MCINRQCSSGLQAVGNVAGQIKAGYCDIGIAGGVETMSMFDMMGIIDPEKVSPAVFDHPVARDCMIPMGITSENIAAKWGIPREKQDALAVESHKKAAEAQKNGLFDSEIVPLMAKSKGKDEGIRVGVTLEQLGKINPAFQHGGSTTAGNASQVSDGAAVVLLAKRSAAEKNKLPIL